jgi:hypothetical protein
MAQLTPSRELLNWYPENLVFCFYRFVCPHPYFWLATTTAVESLEKIQFD